MAFWRGDSSNFTGFPNISSASPTPSDVRWGPAELPPSLHENQQESLQVLRRSEDQRTWALGTSRVNSLQRCEKVQEDVYQSLSDSEDD